MDNGQMQLRTGVLNQLVNSVVNRPLIVTYPEALMEKAVNAQALRQATVLIKLQEKLEAETLAQQLTGFGFERVDFVYEPGQFALRGGIGDLFSFGK